MDASGVLKKYFDDPAAFALVLEHSHMVADKALAIAASVNARVDITFIEEAALLHDIGVARVYAPKLGCFGNAPYICHGVLGREILDGEDLPAHAMVCERHIGIGLTADDIIRQKLPLPAREMVPLTLEEKLICFADLFYSKNPGNISAEKSLKEIRYGLRKFGAHKVAVFDRWLTEWGVA